MNHKERAVSEKEREKSKRSKKLSRRVVPQLVSKKRSVTAGLDDFLRPVFISLEFLLMGRCEV